MQDSLDAFLDDLRAAAADVPAPQVGASLAALFRDGTVPTAAPAVPRRHPRGLRIAIAGAVAGFTFGGLGVAGALPAGLQEKMADVADVVGINLPHSEPELLEETEDAVTTTTSTSSSTTSTSTTSPAPGRPAPTPGGGTTNAPFPVPGPPAVVPPVTQAPGQGGPPPGRDEDRPGKDDDGRGEDKDDEVEVEDEDEKDKDKDKDKPSTTTTTSTTQAPRAERRDRRTTVPSLGVSPGTDSALTSPSPRTTSTNED